MGNVLHVFFCSIKTIDPAESSFVCCHVYISTLFRRPPKRLKLKLKLETNMFSKYVRKCLSLRGMFSLFHSLFLRNSSDHFCFNLPTYKLCELWNKNLGEFKERKQKRQRKKFQSDFSSFAFWSFFHYTQWNIFHFWVIQPISFRGWPCLFGWSSRDNVIQFGRLVATTLQHY